MLESLSWILSHLSSLFDYLDISNSKSKEWVFVSYAYVYDMCVIIIIFFGYKVICVNCDVYEYDIYMYSVNII